MSYSETADLLEYDYNEVTTIVMPTGNVSDNNFKQVGDYEYYNENPIVDDRGAGLLATDFNGCTDAQGAYGMDNSILGVDCGTDFNQKPDECAVSCRKVGEVPNVSIIKCKNPKKNRWVPTPKKYGDVSCAPKSHQTRCGPISKYYQIEPEADIECKSDKCQGSLFRACFRNL